MKILLIALIAVFSQGAFAGSQTNTDIKNAKYSIKAVGQYYTIAVEGTYTKKGKKPVQVSCESTGTGYLFGGVINNVNCDKYYKCELMNLRRSGNLIIADVIDDSKIIGQLEIGKVSNDLDLIPTATLSPKWTEDKYSWFEKQKYPELEDKSYCSIALK